jgi:hypothetical protein
MDPNAPMAEATATTTGAFGAGQPVTVQLHVTDMMSGKPMGPDAFATAHTKRIHVLGIDPSLTDYSHWHPEPGAKAGDWSFQFTPKFDRPYHLWLDVKPVGGRQAYVMLTVNERGTPAPVQKLRSLEATEGAVSASLAFDAPLVAGQAVMGHLRVRRDGKPFSGLQPVMGAFAHIVGIAQDWRTIAHVHPMGAEPTRADQRGGPAIDFHLEPAQPGFLKLFAQIQVDGKAVYLPFGVTVAAAPGVAAAEPMATRAGGEAGAATAIPDSADAIWRAIDQHAAELKATIARGELKAVHRHAFAIRDLVAALPARSPALAADEQAKLAEEVKFVATLAARLDQSGDAGDAAGSQASFEQLSGVLTGITRYK